MSSELMELKIPFLILYSHQDKQFGRAMMRRAPVVVQFFTAARATSRSEQGSMSCDVGKSLSVSCDAFVKESLPQKPFVHQQYRVHDKYTTYQIRTDAYRLPFCFFCAFKFVS